MRSLVLAGTEAGMLLFVRFPHPALGRMLMGLAGIVLRGRFRYIDKVIASQFASPGTFIHALVQTLHALPPAFSRRVLRAALGATLSRSLIASPDGGPLGPHVAVLDVTYACNLRCSGCLSGDMNRETGMPFERLGRLLAGLSACGTRVIAIGGGEPLLYPRLFEAIRSRPEIFFVIFTNGTRLEARVDEIRAHPNLFLMVGIDGMPASHERRRGAGAFRSLSKGIAALRRARVPFGTSVTVDGANSVEAGSDAFAETRIASGSVLTLFLLYSHTPCANGLSRLDDRGYARFSESVTHLRKRHPGHVFVNLPWDERHLSRQGCFAATHVAHIDAQGGVRICPFSRRVLMNVHEVGVREACRRLRDPGSREDPVVPGASGSRCPASGLPGREGRPAPRGTSV